VKIVMSREEYADMFDYYLKWEAKMTPERAAGVKSRPELREMLNPENGKWGGPDIDIGSEKNENKNIRQNGENR
jgi:hypothetical protein